MNESAIQKVRQLKALLLAITGSQGSSEMGDDIDAFLDVCLELAGDALRLAEQP